MSDDAGLDRLLAGLDDDLGAVYRYLHDLGVPTQRLRRALVDGDPRTALAEFRLVGPGPRHSLEEAGAKSGLAADELATVLAALGIARPTDDVRFLTAADLEAVALFARTRSLFGAESVARFGRVVTLAMSRIADAAVSMFATSVEDPLLRSSASQLDITAAAEEGLAAMGLVPDLLVALFQRQAVEAVRRTAIAHGTDTSYETVTVTVGFADLVGSTAWSRAQTPHALADALGEFERLAHGVLGDGSRLIKSIGDEVMFMAPSPARACHAALDLVAAVALEPRLPQLRVGLAHGRAVALDGDLYGPVVNLAARLVHQGTPGQTVVDEALRAAADAPELDFAALPPRDLAGFDQPVSPWLLTRAPGRADGAGPRP